MSQPVLQELPVGTRVQDTLIVLDVEARGGDTPHTIVTFGNAAGRLPSAPVWASESHRIAGLTRGNVVHVVGTITTYRDRRQLAISSIRPLRREETDWRGLLPTVGDVGRYWCAVDRWRDQIRGPRLARTLGLFYDDPGFRERYQQCPAGTSGHHAQLGGLLKHTWEVAHIAGEISRLCPNADPDLVLAGALLHDVGKLEAYRWDGPFETTVAGSALGHVVLGLLLVDRQVRGASPMPCTEAELLLLQHLILSHHGKLEYGAPVLPMTLEAEIVHYADEASAKTASFDLALQDPENFPGGREISARAIWQLDRRRAWRAHSDWGRDRPDT
ncbi:MAG TPA: HD domain-containing protein [Gemmatimonadales bacterium]|jgi:3'-5' exoribonuclease